MAYHPFEPLRPRRQTGRLVVRAQDPIECKADGPDAALDSLIAEAEVMRELLETSAQVEELRKLEHALNNLRFIASLQLEQPTLTTQQLAQAVLDRLAPTAHHRGTETQRGNG